MAATTSILPPEASPDTPYTPARDEAIKHLISSIGSILDEFVTSTAKSGIWWYETSVDAKIQLEAVTFVEQVRTLSGKFFTDAEKDRFKNEIAPLLGKCRIINEQCQEAKASLPPSGRTEADHSNYFKKILLTPSDIHEPDECILGRIIKNGDLDSLIFFLTEFPAAISIPIGPPGKSVFLINIAAMYGHKHILKFLMERFPETLNQKSEEGRTLLHDLARFNHEGAIKLLHDLHPRDFEFLLWTENSEGVWPITDAAHLSIVSEEAHPPVLRSVLYLRQVMNEKNKQRKIESKVAARGENKRETPADLFDHVHAALECIGPNWVSGLEEIPIQNLEGEQHFHKITQVFDEYQTKGVKCIALYSPESPGHLKIYFLNEAEATLLDKKKYLTEIMERLEVPEGCKKISFIGEAIGGLQAATAAMIYRKGTQELEVIARKSILPVTLRTKLKRQGVTICLPETVTSSIPVTMSATVQAEPPTEYNGRPYEEIVLDTIAQKKAKLVNRVQKYLPAEHKNTPLPFEGGEVKMEMKLDEVQSQQIAAAECLYHELAYDGPTLSAIDELTLPLGDGTAAAYEFRNISAFNGLNCFTALPVNAWHNFDTSDNYRTFSEYENRTYKKARRTPAIIKLAFRGTGCGQSATRDTGRRGAGLDDLAERYPIVLQEFITNLGSYISKCYDTAYMRLEDIAVIPEFGGHSLGAADAQNFYVFFLRFLKSLMLQPELRERNFSDSTDDYMRGCYALINNLAGLRVQTLNAPGTSIEMCEEAARLHEWLATERLKLLPNAKPFIPEITHKRVDMDVVMATGHCHIGAPIPGRPDVVIHSGHVQVMSVTYPYTMSKLKDKLLGSDASAKSYGPHQDKWYKGGGVDVPNPRVLTNQNPAHHELFKKEFCYGTRYVDTLGWFTRGYFEVGVDALVSGIKAVVQSTMVTRLSNFIGHRGAHRNAAWSSIDFKSFVFVSHIDMESAAKPLLPAPGFDPNEAKPSPSAPLDKEPRSKTILPDVELESAAPPIAKPLLLAPGFDPNEAKRSPSAPLDKKSESKTTEILPEPATLLINRYKEELERKLQLDKKENDEEWEAHTKYIAYQKKVLGPHVRLIFSQPEAKLTQEDSKSQLTFYAKCLAITVATATTCYFTGPFIAALAFIATISAYCLPKIMNCGCGFFAAPRVRVFDERGNPVPQTAAPAP